MTEAPETPETPEPKKKKPRPWGAVSGRKRKPGRKRMKGNRKEVLKNPNWTGVLIRVEHYGFLRELRAYYKNEPFGKLLGTLIIQEYTRILHKVDPVKASLIRRAYKSEKYKHEVVELDD